MYTDQLLKIKYDDKMRDALSKSICKWKKILYNKEIDNGSHDCALCQNYKHAQEGTCSACPISQVVKAVGCNNTPYERWNKHQRKHMGALAYVKCWWCSVLAWRELRFLKKLKRRLENGNG